MMGWCAEIVAPEKMNKGKVVTMITRNHVTSVAWVLGLLAMSPLTSCRFAVTPPPADSADVPDDGSGGTGPDDGTGGGEPGAKTLVVFDDPDSDFSTTDVNDVEEEIVQFDADTGQIIWATTGEAYLSFDIDGNFLASRFFQIRFGTKDGQRKAYFTETGPATICDIEIQNGELLIFPTNETVPQE
jgi:hypothetical protein